MDNTTFSDAEIFFGLVSPVGTNDDRVISTLVEILNQVNYSCKIIRLSDFLKRIKGLSTIISEVNEYQRIDTLMSAGNELRKILEDGGSLASAGIYGIREFRMSQKGDQSQPIKRQAYILKSLKHPHEVDLLRQVYGRSFWLVSIYSPENTRSNFLGEKIKEKSFDDITPLSELTEHLVKRDQEESDGHGQNVRKTFPLGDVFIDANLDSLKDKMERFVKLLFGYPYHTPTIDEYGMFLAQASALMSSSLARQVGASIMGLNGSIISTGTNEVPFVDGGICTEDVGHIYREFEKGFDSNDKEKRRIVGNFLQSLQKKEWLHPSKKDQDINELVNEVLRDKELKNSQIMNVTEFGREVHAEMTALAEAARKTLSVKEGTLYCTTFPCHVCTKHIIAAGIQKVTFIEPYRKSLAEDLFNDFISVDKKSEAGKKIEFNSFVGIAPRRYMDIFKWSTRKDENNKKLQWEAHRSHPRFGEELIAIKEKETNAITVFLKKIERKGLTFS